jgi:tetratricopeptide (TPR) repeat protein
MARIFISHSSRDQEQAARLLKWLKIQGFTETFLDFDKHAGVAPGADWEKTLYREIIGADAVILILTINWFDSKWCFAEFTQARAFGKAIFPLIESPTGETYIAPDIQNLDLVKDRQGGLERLASELTRIALNSRGGFPWDSMRPPYPGLLAFDEADAAIYFGRDDDIRRVIERLNARRAQGGIKLVVLLGASGSGKSSLLRAGVLPRLKRDPQNWIALPPFRPQLHPLDELAQALATGLGAGGDWRQWREALVAEKPGPTLSALARDLRAAHRANEAQILISIDQAEELFSMADKADGEQFLAALDAVLADGMPFIVLMGLRSDYLGHLQQARALQARFEEFSLKPMPLERVRDIIEGPARVAALTVDEALITAAMKNAPTEDVLPLLAFTLRELYDRFAKSGRLTVEAYRALGDDKAGLSPLENAVRRKADEVLAEARPSAEDQQVLKAAFVPAMVRVNAAGDYVRRPARLDALPAAARPMIERLAKARLLILRQDGDAVIVEVAHEALLRKWPLLRGWLDEEREFLIGKDQLELDLRDWERAPSAQKSEALLSGLKLTRARAWLVAKPHQLSEQEHRFIAASLAHHEAQLSQRERLRWFVQAGSLAAAMVLAVVAAVAVWQWYEASTQRDQATAARDQATMAREQVVDANRNTIETLDELAADVPGNVKLLRSIADSSDKTGEALESIGNNYDALVFYSYGPAIRKQIRDTLIAQGHSEEALEADRKSIANARKLVAIGQKVADSGVDGGGLPQAALADGADEIGDALAAESNLDDALAAYRRGIALAQTQAEAHRNNPLWQSDLADGHAKIGDILLKQGKRGEAAAAYRRSLDSRIRLAALNKGTAVECDAFRKNASGSWKAARDTEFVFTSPFAASTAFSSARGGAKVSTLCTSAGCESTFGVGPGQTIRRGMGLSNDIDMTAVIDQVCTEGPRAWNWCENMDDPGPRIAGCTTVIASGREETLTLDPKYPRAYKNRGFSFWKNGDFNSAIRDYDRAIELDPEYADAFNNRGVAYWEKAEYDRAIADYDKSIQLAPEYADVFFNRGLAYADKGNYNRAIADYDQAITLDPKFTAAFSYRGLAYLSKRAYDKAIEDFDRIIEFDRESDSAFNNRGVAYWNKGDRNRAIKEYDKAIELNPKNAKANQNRCFAHAVIGALDSALADCNAALRLAPDDVEFLSTRGLVFLKLGRFEDSIADYDAVLRAAPKDADGLYGRGTAKLRKGDDAGGASDVAAAKAINSGIAAKFASFGVT